MAHSTREQNKTLLKERVEDFDRSVNHAHQVGSRLPPEKKNRQGAVIRKPVYITKAMVYQNVSGTCCSSNVVYTITVLRRKNNLFDIRENRLLKQVKQAANDAGSYND